MIRVLRVKATGQWCGPAITADRIPDDTTYADRVAETLGLEPGSLEVVDAEEDPRTGELLPDPNVTPEPTAPGPTADERQAELLDGLAVEWGVAAADLRSGKSAAAADSLDRAAEKAKGAAIELRSK
jgi:hypothetical protein